MWCDNCLLLFPLRAGAIAWGVVILLYSAAGGILLVHWGQYLFFVSPEWYLYGGIGLMVAFVALINILALSNRSYLWSRVCKFCWPFLLVLSGIRAALMIWELTRGQDKIAWECANGGQLWNATAIELAASTTTMPVAFCTHPFQTLFTAFVIALLVDIGFQLYMAFLNWRFGKLLEHYRKMNGPMMGGYYNAY